MSKELPALGQLDVAAVRTNQLPISGFGQIADITVVLDEDIAKTATVPFSLEFVDSKAIELSQEEIPVATQDASTEVATTTGIEDLSQAGIRLFPNPAQESIHLEFPERNVLQLALLTPTGQVLQQQTLTHQTHTQLPVSSLPAGMYLLRLQTQDDWLTEKIMIVR
ncbi:MAG: T9SS type A sorting domain-containing protein [Bacteroidota bacterium]